MTRHGSRRAAQQLVQQRHAAPDLHRKSLRRNQAPECGHGRCIGAHRGQGWQSIARPRAPTPDAAARPCVEHPGTNQTDAFDIPPGADLQRVAQLQQRSRDQARHEGDPRRGETGALDGWIDGGVPARDQVRTGTGLVGRARRGVGRQLVAGLVGGCTHGQHMRHSRPGRHTAHARMGAAIARRRDHQLFLRDAPGRSVDRVVAGDRVVARIGAEAEVDGWHQGRFSRQVEAGIEVEFKSAGSRTQHWIARHRAACVPTGRAGDAAALLMRHMSASQEIESLDDGPGFLQILQRGHHAQHRWQCCNGCGSGCVAVGNQKRQRAAGLPAASDLQDGLSLSPAALRREHDQIAIVAQGKCALRGAIDGPCVQ